MSEVRKQAAAFTNPSGTLEELLRALSEPVPLFVETVKDLLAGLPEYDS